ncbi:hypothetical protein [Phyllobacterium bourgognense]|uniref:Uncharacterized protein n=1 Tax=Phyllobacterium bourgognense TaxID=314236 RepID=A0A368YL10_9HYPH|nr:hypothetical protein [Phyllobacterium bourgognense]RCW80922.1 hypothetical protein C7476_11278 [Phyllobacterium bourgognense]
MAKVIGRFEASVRSYSYEKHNSKAYRGSGAITQMSDTIDGRSKCQISAYGITLRDSVQEQTSSPKAATIRDVTIEIDHNLLIEAVIAGLERGKIKISDEQIVRLIKGIGSEKETILPVQNE